MNKIEMHKSICDSLNELYKNKNSDYGNSFEKTRELIPNAILVRLHDKLNRLTCLMIDKNNQKVKDESIKDTLTDLANYCLLELVEMKAEEKSRPITSDTVNRIRYCPNCNAKIFTGVDACPLCGNENLNEGN